MSDENKTVVMNADQAAIYIGISVRTLHRLRAEGKFAPEIEISDKRRGWFKHDLINWLQDRKKTTNKS